MSLIKNLQELSTNPLRKICLEIIEAGLESIQPEKLVPKIQSITMNLKDCKRIFLVGFGKGSAGISKHIEKILGKFLTKGYVIDVEQEKFTNIEFIQGTHPLPSETNLLFTKGALSNLNDLNDKDLVLVVIAGGGSALFVNPYKITLEKLIEINKSLLRSGANIMEMNIVRKHLDIVKGGGLAKLLYPAKIVALIASDVPGNNLSTIASGPTVKDLSTKEQAFEIMTKYNLWEKINLTKDDFLETPKEDKYFSKVNNILILSNQTAIHAMEQKAKELGFNTLIYSDKFQSEAKIAGKILIEKTPPHTVLIAGGETTVKVTGNGQGGRNQELVLAALEYLSNDTLIASFDSDGWDNSPLCGEIGDSETLEKAKKLNLNIQEYLENNNTYPFFQKTGDGIVTDKLPSNVSDLMIVIKQ